MLRRTALRAAAAAVACVGAAAGARTLPGDPQRPAAPRLLLLGDSLTYGQTGPGQALPGGFRAPLHDLLTARGVAHRFAGSRRDNASARLREAGQDAHEGWPGYRVDQAALLLPQRPPDAALVVLGTNDLAQLHDPAGRPDPADPTRLWLFASRLAARLDALLLALPGVPVVVAAVPPYLRRPDDAQPDPAATAYDRALRDTVARAAAAGRPVSLADGWAPFTPAGRVDRGLLGADGTHPTAAGYAALAAALAPPLARALRRAGRR